MIVVCRQRAVSIRALSECVWERGLLSKVVVCGGRSLGFAAVEIHPNPLVPGNLQCGSQF